jgi:hypothetical protein
MESLRIDISQKQCLPKDVVYSLAVPSRGEPSRSGLGWSGGEGSCCEGAPVVARSPRKAVGHYVRRHERGVCVVFNGSVWLLTVSNTCVQSYILVQSQIKIKTRARWCAIARSRSSPQLAASQGAGRSRSSDRPVAAAAPQA